MVFLSFRTVRTIQTTVYGSADESNMNVQMRMPNNSIPQTSSFMPRDSSTPIGSKTTIMSTLNRYGTASPMASTIADSSFSMPARTPLLRTGTPTNIMSKGPCGEGSGVGGYNMTRHHYVPGTQSPVALDRYDRTFGSKGKIRILF